MVQIHLIKIVGIYAFNSKQGLCLISIKQYRLYTFQNLVM